VRVSKHQNTSLGAGSKTPNRASAPALAAKPRNGGASAAAASPPAPLRFAALDFETADYGRDSACSLSIVIVENDAIIDTWTSLIRPPRRDFVFTYLHGIAWEHVKNQPSFGELWGDIAGKLAGASFVAAHNASFDRSVLRTCCETAAIEPVKLPFVCTVKAARSIWGFYPTTLADVCRQLRIPLRHHDAESDARACARILLAARERGHPYDHVLKTCALKPARGG
jgi:DNA polymerase III subunit epsilon